MPGYKGHIAGGCAAFALTLLMVPHLPSSSLTMIEWFLFATAGALFPDIDIKSKGQHYFYWIAFLLFIFLAVNHHYTHLAIVSTLSIIPLLVKHRGIFHRLWFIMAVPLIIWYLIAIQFPHLYTTLLLDTLFFIAGAISHLWLDMGMRMFRW